MQAKLGAVVIVAAVLLSAPAVRADDWRAGRLEELNQVLIWQLQGRAEVDGPHINRRPDAPPVEFRWRCVAPEREPCVLPVDAARAERTLWGGRP